MGSGGSTPAPSQGHGCRREHWGLFSTQHGTGPLDDKIASSTNISCVGFCSQAPESQRLPQVEPWLGKRASDCVVSGEAARPEVCGHCRTWTSSLEREQALTKSVFPEATSGPGGWECHRCACLSRCLTQGVCGECAVFTKLNESAVSG